MEKPTDKLGEPREGFDFEDLRESQRFTLLIRSAKLVCGGCEFLCIVRDVSASGVRLRVFHPLPAVRRVILELGSGDRFDLEPVWERDGHAGFRFADPIDVSRFIAEVSPYPKRGVRLRLSLPVTVSVDGECFDAEICNLSRQGARIETDRRLAIGQKLKLEASKLPDLHATVCWRNRPAYGLVFRQVLSFEELAQRTAAIQLTVSQGNGSGPVSSWEDAASDGHAGLNSIASPFMQ